MICEILLKKICFQIIINSCRFKNKHITNIVKYYIQFKIIIIQVDLKYRKIYIIQMTINSSLNLVFILGSVLNILLLR